MSDCNHHSHDHNQVEWGAWIILAPAILGHKILLSHIIIVFINFTVQYQIVIIASSG